MVPLYRNLDGAAQRRGRLICGEPELSEHQLLFFFTDLLVCSNRPAPLLLFCGGKISIKTLWIKINLSFRQKCRAVINIRSRKVGFKLRRVAETSDETRLKGINRLLVTGRLGSKPTVLSRTTRKDALSPGTNQRPYPPLPSPPQRHHLTGQEVINTPEGEVSKKRADEIY